MSRKAETVERRAVRIAAKVMQACGLFRFDTVTKCRRICVNDAVCDACIESWLLAKASRELRMEAMDKEGGNT